MARAPNPKPTTLAEKVAAQGSTCPIPATHDRLFEIHHWWHELARWYHEPEPFRYRLGAFIQAARSVTFMLQSEKDVFKSFDWYDKWVLSAKDDPILKWLNSARTDFVHRGALEPDSWLELRCLDNPKNHHGSDEEPFKMVANPFFCTHFYMRGPETDHGHEFERHWSVDGLKGAEILSVCADIYDRLDDIVVEAHKQTGRNMEGFAKPGARHRLPCMEDTTRFRVIQSKVVNGHEVWIDEPSGLHQD
jgi:hypothetical protein